MSKGPLKRLLNAAGSGAIAQTLSEPVPFYVAEIRLTLATSSADLADFKAYIDSKLGSSYDHTVSQPDPLDDLASATAFRFADPVPPVIFPGDVLTIEWPNAGGVTYGLEVIGHY